MSISMAVGLGNSEAKYALTRHNAGVVALRRYAAAKGAQFKYNKYCRAHEAQVGLGKGALQLVFMDGFMNESGLNLSALLKFHKLSIEECVVLFDDITLEPGRIKLAQGGSAGGHNGVADIMERCGNGFARLKIGIGAKPDKRMDLARHVLGPMTEAELAALIDLDCDIAKALELCVLQGLAKAQNAVNRRPPKPKPEEAPKEQDSLERLEEKLKD